MTPGQLAALFTRERQRFARTFPRVRGAWLSLDDRPCPSPPCRWRDFAAADLDTGEVIVSRRLLELPAPNVRAILRHELGHLADPSPERRGAERRADRLAALAAGRPILYDAREVQTDDPRAPYRVRPPWLHK